jgi:hypothetical protein
MVAIGSYSEILREKKELLSTLHTFFKLEKDPQPGTSSETWNLCIMPQLKNINAGALQKKKKKLLVWASNMPKYMYTI